MEGNNLEKKGETSLERKRIAPAFSPIFIIPNQKVIIPAKGKAISITATLVVLNNPSTICLKITVSPKNRNLRIPTKKDKIIKAIQI